ncbi:hypothetical protein GKO32_14200 [Amycolatopsis sp. RM579]|uniref:Ferric oxidoreductase domain-containing protein n=1 Tax=Amycolatopsis pithecellobii TaxID=664692 RepID=A0A6N7Z4B2_9PSEU|nr:hypothetical protein [Amycolatopsis pithecellobii]
MHEVAALSAHAAFVFLCLGLCWGVFTSTGWLRRLTGRQATRNSHVVLVTLALAFAMSHATAFVFMEGDRLGPLDLAVPFRAGDLTVALGIVSVELMLALVASTLVRRLLSHRRWLWLHRLGYPAVALGVVHSFTGALVDGHLRALWLFGVALVVPVALVAGLRFLPARLFTTAGLLEVRQ